MDGHIGEAVLDHAVDGKCFVSILVNISNAIVSTIIRFFLKNIM